MEEYIKAQFRLIECYKGSSNKEEAEENCKQYSEKMIHLLNEERAFGMKNVMEELKD